MKATRHNGRSGKHGTYDAKLNDRRFDVENSEHIVIYFGEWIKSVIPINLIVLLLLVHVVYIGIRCYVKDWQEERGYY